MKNCCTVILKLGALNMNTKLKSVVNHLIQISIDGERGFRNAAEQIKNDNLRVVFNQKAEGCKKAAYELQTYMHQFKEQAEDSGTMLGTLHRGWMTVKSALTGHDDHAILAECELGEDAAKAAYKTALEDENLPNDLRLILQSQYEGVIANHDEIRDLRDAYNTK